MGGKIPRGIFLKLHRLAEYLEERRRVQQGSISTKTDDKVDAIREVIEV